MGDAEEIEAIKALKARYFRLMDTKDWDVMIDVFVPDVEIDMTGENGVLTHTAQDFMTRLRESIGDVSTIHHGHMPEIELTSPTTARGIWSMEDKLWWPAGRPIVHLHGYGHYHETYQKTERGWRIKTMKLTRLRRDVVPASGTAGS